jgi:hypothetical protein
LEWNFDAELLQVLHLKLHDEKERAGELDKSLSSMLAGHEAFLT